MTVKNLGGVDSGSFYVDLYFNEESAPAPQFGERYHGNDYAEVPSLLTGGQTTITFPDDGVLGEPITSGVAETWSMWAVVDYGYDVKESDEGNNVYGPVTVEWS